MTNTTNFNFLIPDGTDNVNLLTQNYPNWTSLDAILKGIKDTGVTTATATKTGTNFAVVRNDTDCNIFRFVATANYVAGDTFTVDGVPVTATSAAGTALPSGAFVINQSVIAIVNSGVLTVLVGGGLSSVDASDVDYDNTVSGLTATDVQAAIDELKTLIPSIPATYDADDIVYDNASSGLGSTDAQGALDELSKAVIYESAETAIGKWIDGSVIYRKCYSGAGSFNTTLTLDATITSATVKPVKIEGSFKKSDGYASCFSTGSNVAVPSLAPTALLFAISNTTVLEYNVIFEYVKI